MASNDLPYANRKLKSTFRRIARVLSYQRCRCLLLLKWSWVPLVIWKTRKKDTNQTKRKADDDIFQNLDKKYIKSGKIEMLLTRLLHARWYLGTLILFIQFQKVKLSTLKVTYINVLYQTTNVAMYGYLRI